MKPSLPYQVTVWLGVAALVACYVLPAGTGIISRLAAAYAVYLIFDEIFKANIERGRQAEEEYGRLWSRIKAPPPPVLSRGPTAEEEKQKA